jgi:hypothetical protein
MKEVDALPNGGSAKQVEETAIDSSASGTNNGSTTSTTKTKAEMATIADLFSFAETIRCKLLIAGGLALSMVSGLVFPGSYEFGLFVLQCCHFSST